MSDTPPQNQQIEECLATIAACGNSAAIEAARSLVQAVLGLHQVALSRMMEIVQRHGGSDRSLIENLSHDDVVSNLLLLHDLHPIGLERRLEEAIAEATPRIAELGGHIEAHSVSQGMLDVRVAGLSTGPATMAARMILEEAMLKHAPDAAGLKFSGTIPPREPVVAQPALITLRIPEAARQGHGPER